MKTFIFASLVSGMVQSPVIALLVAVALLLLVDLYSQYLESKKIICTPYPDLNNWAYQDINTMARLHKLKPANRKKQTLISLLQNV